MHSLTREQFDRLPVRFGGDLWNPSQLWRKAYAAIPEATSISYVYLSTGLWCDVTGTLPDGSTVTRRIFD